MDTRLTTLESPAAPHKTVVRFERRMHFGWMPDLIEMIPTDHLPLLTADFEALRQTPEANWIATLNRWRFEYHDYATGRRQADLPVASAASLQASLF